jgi:hypothetical protein
VRSIAFVVAMSVVAQLGGYLEAPAAAQLSNGLFVYRVAAPDVSAERAIRLANEVFGFNGNLEEFGASFSVIEAGDPGRLLTLYKASGAVEFVDGRKYKIVAYNAVLPSPPKAEAIARLFLRRSGLFPPNPTIETALENVVTDDGTEVPNAFVVRFKPQLKVDARLLAPVRDGDVTVWLGNLGEVIRLQSDFRTVQQNPLSVSRRPDDQTRADLVAQVGTTAGLRLAPAYAIFEPHEAQPYLDPVLELVDSDGAVAARTRATAFTPLLAYLGPDPGLVIPSTGGILLSATATDGMPPYQFHWISNLDGPLGSGELLDAQLSPGKHRIDLTVRDANDAGVSASVLLDIAQSGFPSPTESVPGFSAAAAVTAVPSGSPLTFDNGITLSPIVQQDRPLILNNIRRGGQRRADNIYFDQFWYEIDINFGPFAVFTVKSQKCLATAGPNANACLSPQGPFARSRGATPLMRSQDKSTLSTSITVDNLPGVLQLDFEYAAQYEYAGPEPPFGGNHLWIIKRPLGGTAPGVRPTVKWTYRPPQLGIGGKTIKEFCSSAPDPQTTPCAIPYAVLNAINEQQIYPIDDFRVKILTAIQPGGTGQKSALVSDTNSLIELGNFIINYKLANTDGAIDRTVQPAWAPGDAFVDITPIQTERVATASRINNQGDWDNVHLKANPQPVAFPGCNDPLSATDTQPCLHLHEKWLNSKPAGTTYSRGQTVNWYILRLHPGQEESPNHPSSINNGEPLIEAGVGKSLVLWVESIASSKQCDLSALPNAGIDNSNRPCEVFPQAMFFTPR